MFNIGLTLESSPLNTWTIIKSDETLSFLPSILNASSIRIQQDTDSGMQTKWITLRRSPPNLGVVWVDLKHSRISLQASRETSITSLLQTWILKSKSRMKKMNREYKNINLTTHHPWRAKRHTCRPKLLKVTSKRHPQRMCPKANSHSPSECYNAKGLQRS